MALLVCQFSKKVCGHFDHLQVRLQLVRFAPDELDLFFNIVSKLRPVLFRDPLANVEEGLDGLLRLNVGLHVAVIAEQLLVGRYVLVLWDKFIKKVRLTSLIP